MRRETVAKHPMQLRKLLVTGLKRTHLIGFARNLRDAVSPAVRRQNRRMLAFYRQFFGPGDLVFDVGANVGNRTSIFLDLGARVVAVEPQEACARELRQKFGGRSDFVLVTAALSAAEGEGEIRISEESTVSSMASDWIDRVKTTGRFGDIDWRGVQKVRMTTLDAVIRSHGLPVFCKIDVEGYEPVVLKGLTQKIRAVSFEFTPEFFDGTADSVRHLTSIGYERFNFSYGESMELDASEWMDAGTILRRLDGMPSTVFGDVYAK
ncbi:MAG: FkbM family methyltransferase [Acidobacteriota bacterium]|nr:FkbM family methyltransferase [Acidobacteriota bacterium]